MCGGYVALWQNTLQAVGNQSEVRKRENESLMPNHRIVIGIAFADDVGVGIPAGRLTHVPPASFTQVGFWVSSLTVRIIMLMP
jgi:hypothetical protein